MATKTYTYTVGAALARARSERRRQCGVSSGAVSTVLKSTTWSSSESYTYVGNTDTWDLEAEGTATSLTLTVYRNGQVYRTATLNAVEIDGLMWIDLYTDGGWSVLDGVIAEGRGFKALTAAANLRRLADTSRFFWIRGGYYCITDEAKSTESGYLEGALDPGTGGRWYDENDENPEAYSGTSLNGVTIRGSGKDVTFLYTDLGFFLFTAGSVTIEDVTFDATTRITGGSPVFRRCVFSGGVTVVGAEAGPVFEDCEFPYSTERETDGISVSFSSTNISVTYGTATFRRCRVCACPMISGSSSDGSVAEAVFEDCEIIADESGEKAVFMFDYGFLTVRRCVIRLDSLVNYPCFYTTTGTLDFRHNVFTPYPDEGPAGLGSFTSAKSLVWEDNGPTMAGLGVLRVRDVEVAAGTDRESYTRLWESGTDLFSDGSLPAIVTGAATVEAVVTDGSDWLTLTSDGDGITATAETNSTGAARAATVEVTATWPDTSTRTGHFAYVQLAGTTVERTIYCPDVTVNGFAGTVDLSALWSFDGVAVLAASTGASWLTYNGGVLTFEENGTGAARQATVTLVGLWSDGAESATFTLTQKDKEYFLLAAEDGRILTTEDGACIEMNSENA